MKNRIVGGRPIVRIADAPYQLSLRFDGGHICGASLISPMHALTAARCYIESTELHRYSVRAGSRFIDEDKLNAKYSTINAFIVHPDYEQNWRNNHDIAVLWLDDELPLGRLINYIQLPVQDEAIPIGEMATVAGWGSTSEKDNFSSNLRVTQVEIHENMQCMARSSLRTIDTNRINDQMICAGDREGDTGICYGDEGAPLIFNGIQIGIASYVGDCARPNFLASYTRVSSYINWINSVLTENEI